MVGITRIWSTTGLLATLLALCLPAYAPAQSPRGGQELPLLYDWVPDGTPMAEIRALNADRYAIVYQNILPRKGASGIVDIDLVLAHLREKLPRNYRGWGVLDFEGAFLERLRKGPGHPHHEATSDSLRKTIDAVKREWPGSRWAFWGLPDVRFWINDKGEQPVSWFSASTAQKEREFKRQAAAFQGLLESVDWITPWIYDMYSFQATKPSDRMSSIAAQKAWARAKMTLCKRVLASRRNGPIPVIPMFCPAFAPGGNVTKPTFVPMKEFVDEVLEPTMTGEVDGLSLWTGMGYRVYNAFRDPENPHQVDLRDQSRDRLKTLLFRDTPFDWNAPNAEVRINDAIRSQLMEQLQLMRKALNSLETGKDADTPESDASHGETSPSRRP